MNRDSEPRANLKEFEQPMNAQEVDPQQKRWQKEELEKNGKTLTANPGDRIDESKTLAEKAKQVAVDAPDITGDHIVVPTYFMVEYPDGERKALHHVRDAEEISDVIRQARMDENGNRIWW
ncbi:hypothetical protein PCC9214_02710 [Planktothrix tepida]|uniref:Uncharacterized protein n=2 Tax=Planktothrix TaxID=54304 RepID=A0A1J1LD11_9CYAN|nr:hypothetical protein PCC9214_02710 [Planktothrix tepida]CAD5957123.1 hypothetical protein NO713_02954 [Planktothrix pseudagardhii]CUR30360.1 conserved hypothetical protein [Planktothrix tepida PCC 9214]